MSTLTIASILGKISLSQHGGQACWRHMDKHEQVKIKKLKESIYRAIDQIVDKEIEEYQHNEWKEWLNEKTEYLQQIKILNQNNGQIDRKRADYLNQAVENNKKANRVRARHDDLKRRYDEGVKYLEHINIINSFKLMVIAIRKAIPKKKPKFKLPWS
jgi:hypothetical protein